MLAPPPRTAAAVLAAHAGTSLASILPPLRGAVPYKEISMKEDKRHDSTSKQPLPSKGEGAHPAASDEPIRSRSADPGQSSYGGFSGEDPRRQAQDLPEGAKPGTKPK
jgi:hypothetical protein